MAETQEATDAARTQARRALNPRPNPAFARGPAVGSRPPPRQERAGSRAPEKFPANVKCAQVVFAREYLSDVKIAPEQVKYLVDEARGRAAGAL